MYNCDIFYMFLFSTRKVGRIVRSFSGALVTQETHTVPICILLSRATSKRETICLSRDTAKTSEIRGGSREWNDVAIRDGGQKTRHDVAVEFSDCYLWWTDSRLVMTIFQAKWHPGGSARRDVRVKSSGIRVFSSPPLLCILSNSMVRLSFPFGKGDSCV